MALFGKMGLGFFLTGDSKQLQFSFMQGEKSARSFFSRIDHGKRVFPGLSRAMETARPAFKAIEMGARMAGRAIRALTARVVTFMATAAAGLRRGASMIAGGFRDIAMGMAPITLAVGAGFRAAAQYERQMSAIGAITRANTKDMTAMALEAQRMGVVSVFSAKQIGEGMEFMARAGAKPQQIIAGISGVADAAAADAITLAQAGDVVSRVVKGMGMEWKEAGHIADVLALASASANTNILALGESFVYGVATSRTLGVSLEETTALMAKMADAGLKGSLGGTAYSNMMTRMGKTTAKGRKILKEFGVEFTREGGKLRKVADIVADFEKELSKIPKVTERQEKVIEVFGRRGARAYNALAASGREATLALEDQLRKSSEGIGAAAKMAERRLDNFLGRLVLLKSSLEGLAIGIFLPFLRNVARSTKSLVMNLNRVLFALNRINAAFVLGEEVEFTEEEVKKFGRSAIEIAWGIREAMDDIREGWDILAAKVSALGGRFKKTFSGVGLRAVAKFITKFMVLGALVTPLILGLGLAKWAIAGFIKIVAGLGTMLLAVFWPVVIAAGILYLAYLKLRKGHEGFLDTAVRVWGEIKTWILDVWNNALKPLWEGFKLKMLPAIRVLGIMFYEVFSAIGELFQMLYQEIFGGNEATRNDWHDTGQTIAQVIIAVVAFVLTAVRGIIKIIHGIAWVLINVLKPIWLVIRFVIDQAAQGVAKFVLAFKDIFSGNLLRGLAKLGAAIVDFITMPLRGVIKMLIKLADLVNIDVPKGIRTFAEEGITGLAFDKQIGVGGKTYDTREEMFRQEGIGIAAKMKPLMEQPSPYVSFERAAMLKEQFGIDIPTGKGELAKSRFESIDAMKEGLSNLGDRVENAVKEKPCVEVESKIDGRNLAIASGKHKQEFKERAGFKSTPWQRRATLEHGVTPVTKAG